MYMGINLFTFLMSTSYLDSVRVCRSYFLAKAGRPLFVIFGEFEVIKPELIDCSRHFVHSWKWGNK